MNAAGLVGVMVVSLFFRWTMNTQRYERVVHMRLTNQYVRRTGKRLLDVRCIAVTFVAVWVWAALTYLSRLLRIGFWGLRSFAAFTPLQIFWFYLLTPSHHLTAAAAIVGGASPKRAGSSHQHG